MNDVLKKLEKVLDDENGFFIKVRFLDGVDDGKLEDVLAALTDIELFYADNDMLPKYLFFLTSAMVPSLFGMVDSYSGIEREKIFVAIDRLDTALNRCFSTNRF